MIPSLCPGRNVGTVVVCSLTADRNGIDGFGLHACRQVDAFLISTSMPNNVPLRDAVLNCPLSEARAPVRAFVSSEGCG